MNKEIEILVEDQLIPIKNNDGRTVVNARDLHEFLESRKDFSSWIKDRIERYDLTENEDYVVFTEFGENSKGGRPKKEYALTLDAAKELSMVEGNEKGKQARKYFIACEKKLKGENPSYLIADPIKRAEKWIQEEKERQSLKEQTKQLAEENKKLGEPNRRRFAQSDFCNGCNRIQTFLPCCRTCKDHLSKWNGGRTEPIIQVASQKRVSWSERRILQSAYAKMGRSRNVRNQEKNDYKTER